MRSQTFPKIGVIKKREAKSEKDEIQKQVTQDKTEAREPRADGRGGGS